MNKKRLKLLIVISAITLAGIMAIQFYGIRNAAMFQEEQFTSTVHVGLKTVANQLLRMQVDTNANILRSCLIAQGFERQNIIPILMTPRLGELIDEEFRLLKINLDYDYGVYKTPSNRFLRTSNETVNGQLLASEHYVSFSCIFDNEYVNLAVFFPEQQSVVLQSVIPWAVLLFLFIIVLVIAFYQIIRMFINEKNLSEMKTDFVNNMTHELKTPIATLSLAADMLIKPEVNTTPCQVQRYARVIIDENNRLKNRVDQVLHITLVEKGEFQMKMKQVDVHRIIDESVKPYKLLIKQQKGKITKNYTASRTNIQGDPDHLENLISNLVDNAIKYSIGSPEILLETTNLDHGINIAVEDKGIGISQEHQKNVFRRFYRVSTGDVHDAKGFGLGLYYVKTVVEAHHGSITVKSQPGAGSRFMVFLPFEQPQANIPKNHHSNE